MCPGVLDSLLSLLTSYLQSCGKSQVNISIPTIMEEKDVQISMTGGLGESKKSESSILSPSKT